jgi:hypothetical protein
VKKYVAYSADWKKKIEMEELNSIEETIFEASTRAAEWALNSGKEIGLLIRLEDKDLPGHVFISLAYKVLSNAGYYNLAEVQREMVKQDFGIDIGEDKPLSKLMLKLRKASLKKSFCIAKITEVQIDGRSSKVPIVCINLGLYEEQQEAKNKCQELNKSEKEKVFVVKKITYNLNDSLDFGAS